MATGDKKQPLDVQAILPQMMEELMKVKAEKDAMVSLIGFLLKKISLPQEEQDQFFKAYVELATEEYQRLIAEHPWFEDYWQKKQSDNAAGSNGTV